METRTKLQKSFNWIAIIGFLACWLASADNTLAQTGWSLQSANQGVTDILVIPRLNKETAHFYQVGSGFNEIRKSIDGGTTWTTITIPGQSTLLLRILPDEFTEGVGFVLATNGLWRTSNNGATWAFTSISIPSGSLRDISGFTVNGIGWIVGDDGKIFKSTDSGVTWTEQISNTTDDLYAVHAYNNNNAVAVGASGRAVRTINGGAYWAPSIVSTTNLNDLVFSGSSLFAVGGGGKIYVTSNGGTSWSLSSTPITTNTLRCGFSDSGVILLGGDNGTLLKSTNGGTSWASINSGRTDNFIRIWMYTYLLPTVTEVVSYAVSNNATLRSTDNGSGCIAPTVSVPTTTVNACVGQNVTLVSTSGGTIATRAWKKNGTVIGLGLTGGGTDAHPQSLVLNNVQLSQAGSYTVQVTSPCGDVTSSIINLSVNLPQQPSTVVGPGTASQNVPTNYSVSPIAGATFTWNAGSGGTVTGSGNSVQLSWSTIGSKNISVTATDNCGTSIARLASVSVVGCAIPSQPSTISLNSGSECASASANYSVTNVSGVTYTWAVSAGGTVTSTGNNATVVWNSSTGSRTITVTPSSSCGSGTVRTLNLTIGSAPAQPTVITGNATVCTGVATAYSVSNVAGVTYTWNTGGGGTVTGSGNAINVTWTSAGAKTLTVTPSTSCGTGTVRTLAVTVTAVPSQPSVISGSTTVATSSSNQFSVTNESGVTYSWNAGTGGTVTGSGNSVNISWSSAGSKTITLTPSNSCGNGTTRTLAVTVNDCAVPAQPSTIAGGATACTSGSGTYSVTSVGGVNYAWNAGTDGSVSGSGNSVTLSWTSVGVKTITVTPSNACGNGTARTLAVTVSQLPAQPSAITGNITPCKNASLTYSVTNVAGVTYTWDIIGTGTITGSGNSINVNWTAAGSHTLRVTPSTACGAGVARTLAVAVNDVPLAASQMTGLTAVCSGSSIPYSVGNVAGVTYTWNGGSGSTVTGSGSAVSISWSTGGTKTVSVTPSNACGNGTASTKTVEVDTTPAQPSTIVGSTAAVGGIAQSYSVTNTPGVTYTWSTNADGVIASTGNTAQVTWSTAGSKTLTVMPSNLCGNGTARTLTVTTTVPCTIPGTPSSITISSGSANIALNGFRRFVVGASSGSTSLNIAVSPSAGTTITPVFGNTWDIVFTIPGTYTISGFGEISGCGAGAPANITVEVCTGTVAAATAINGPLTNVCSGTTTRYSVASVPGVLFDWSLSSFSSGTISPLNADKSIVDITWSSTFGGDNLTVRAKNACNVLSDSFTETVFSKGKPSYAGFAMFLTGSICAGSGGTLSMNIGLPEPATTYTWQLNGAGTVSGDNLSASALADGLARQIKIYGTNACYKDEFITSIDYGGGSPIPVTPSPVSGPSTIDFNTVGTYSVDAQSAGVNFSWDAGSDATITAGASANIKNIQWSTGGLKTVFVNAVNTCGDGYRSYSVFVNGPCVAPSVPGSISGEATVCAGVEYQYSVPFQNFDTFNWSAGADATITGSGGIRSIKWSTGGAKTISVTATNLCTTSTARTLGVTVNTIPTQPVALIGSATGCNGATQQISLASPIAGVTYTWEVQGGNVVTSGAQGQIADITWTSLGVNQVKLKPSNSCGNGTPRTLDVTVGTVPDQPSFISGEGEVCSATSKTYSVTNTSGVTYAWNAGSGGTVTGSGNSVSISWSTTGAKTITVTPSNSCGNGTARTLTVNVGGVPVQPAAISGLASPTLGNEEAYSVTSVAGVNYTWSLSDKGTLSTSGNNASVFWNTSGSATLTITPSNACGNGTARTASITVNKISQTITFTVTSPMLANEPLTLNGEASSGLPIAYTSSNTSVAEVFGNELIIKSFGSVDITASQAGDATFAAASPIVRSLTINKANQVITFNALSAATFGEGNIELAGTSDSGLPVTYSSSNTSVVTASGNSLTIVGAGTASIIATQGGDAIYNAATPVVRALTVNKADQTISFESLVAKGITDPPFSLSATASSELAISYISSNTSVATIAGSTVTIVGQGTTTITASQSGNANYNAATSVGQTLTVNDKQSQSITFGSIAAKAFGDAGFTLGATASSGLTVSYTSSNTSVATVSGTTVTIVGAGTTTITASQAGDATFNSATSVTQSLVVNKASQTITFSAIGTKQLSSGTFELAATASSGLTVSYTSSNASVATISGTTVTLVSAGSTTITASQAGNDNFNVASSVDQSLTVVDKQVQTIAFSTLPAKNVGDAAFNLNATTSSGLAVTYASSNSSVATISGSTVTIVAAGTTNITASQAGNNDYLAAADVVQALVVNTPTKQSQTISFAALSAKTFGDAAFDLSATASSGLTVSYTSSDPAVATISGSTVTIVGAGTSTIKASQGGDTQFGPAADIEQTLVVNKANQTITFAALADRGITQGAFNLTATSTSGLAISYTSATTSVATISGLTVTPVTAGTTILTASQAGNSNYNAATDVTQSLTIVDDTPKRIISVDGSLKFDDLILLETATKTVTVSNTGNDKLNITSITYPEGFSGDLTSGSVAAGASLSITITFAPTQAKEYTGSMVLTSNATSGTGSINVNGKGITITAIADLLGTKPMSLSPNPGTGVFTLEIHQPISKKALVTDELGRQTGYVDLQPIGEDLYQIDITQMSQGIYFLRLPADQKVKVTRLIKVN